MFSQACVILFTGRGGVCLSACWVTTTPPWSRHPCGADTHPHRAHHPWSRHPPPPGSRHPPEQTPPRADTPPCPAQSMLGDTVNARAVGILLECNLVHSMLTFKWFVFREIVKESFVFTFLLIFCCCFVLQCQSGRGETALRSV